MPSAKTVSVQPSAHWCVMLIQRIMADPTLLTRHNDGDDNDDYY